MNLINYRLGTGTVTGDPVEVNSLGRYFKDNTIQKKRYIGSVKTNIGHLESAAGVAGLIKVLLMMKNNKIVESLLKGDTNPQIDFQKYNFEVPTDLKDWEKERKLACVNSFGFGGSNVHAVLSSYDEIKSTAEGNVPKDLSLVCFSGQNKNGLKESIQEFTVYAETNSDLNMTAVSYTSTVRRDHFSVRKAVTAKTLKELVEKLKFEKILETPHRGKRVVFVFGGMGIAWKGMCKELMSRFQVFKQKMQEIDNCLKEYVCWSIVERLLEDYDVEDTLFGPIATFACQVALVELWNHLGIKPDCVLGQSIGEVAASHVAGIWSLNEAVKIIFHRTDVLASATGGKMLFVRNYQVEKLESMLTAYEGRATIGLYYSSTACVISGDADAIKDIERDLMISPNEHKHGISLETLRLNTAFHSHHTEEAKHEIEKRLAHMEGRKPNMEIISTVSGEIAQNQDFSTPDYWGKNIRDPVQFGKAVVNAAKDNFNIFLEIGPRAVLHSHVKDLFIDDKIVAVPSMKKMSELSRLIETTGKMYEHGFSLNWNTLYDEPRQVTEYPKYIFCPKQHLFISEEPKQELMGIEPKMNLHPFLKTIHYSSTNCEHKIILSPTSIASVYEHRFSGNILVPGILYAEAGFALAQLYFNKDETEKCSISLALKHPVLLKKEKIEELDIDITTNNMPESFSFAVRDQNNVYAEVNVSKGNILENNKVDIQSVKKRCKTNVTKQELYTYLRNVGITLGDHLQLVGETVKTETEVLSRVSLNPAIKEEMKETTIHPAVLDAMLHCTGAFYQQGVEAPKALPIKIECIRIRKPVENEMFVHVIFLKDTRFINVFHIYLVSLDGTVLAEIEKFTSKNLGRQKDEMLFELQWFPTEIFFTSDASVKPPQRLLIIADKKLNKDTPGHISVDYLDISNTETDVTEMLRVKSLALDTWSAVVFCCQKQTPATFSGKKFLQNVTKQSMNLRGLLLYLYTVNANIPLIVVTENAVNTEHKTTCVDLVTGSCWGFIRSVLREQVYSMTFIVDLQTDANDNLFTLLTTAVTRLLMEDYQGCHEFVFANNSVLCQKMITNDSMPLYRNNKLDVKCRANLLSKNKHSVHRPYLQYERQEIQSDLPDSVEITTTSVVIHNPRLYQQCVSDSRIITLETIGKVSAGNDSQQNVSAFFPCKVSTFMLVPKQCIIEIHKIPFYEPGLLTKLVLLWHHCMLATRHGQLLNKPPGRCSGDCKASNNKHVEIVILSSERTRPVANALVYMLEKIENNHQIEIVDISHKITPKHAKVIILSTIELNENIIKEMYNLWPDVERIVCMEQLLPIYADLFLCHTNPWLQIQIVRASDIFTPSSAMETMPEIKTWILHNKDTIHKIANTFQDLTFCQTEINAANLMQISTIHLSSDERCGTQSVLALDETLLRPDGVYIVVGGLTGLGWECVHFLAKQGAGTIVTINRRQKTMIKLQEIYKLEAEHCCQICILQADVTSMKSLKKVFKEIEKRFPTKPLKGIYFGAGVLEDKTLINMSEDMFLKVAAPKIQGAWNMHLLTQTIPLDFFILHSSVTAVFGTPGQCNYGAANAFQDSLAHKRRQAGLVGQSINWGPLDLGMLHEKPAVKATLEEQGYLPLSVEDIHECLLSILMLDKCNIIAAKFNSIKLTNSIENENNKNLQFKLSSILDIPVKKYVSKESSNGKHNVDTEQLKVTDADTRLKTITEYVKQILLDILGLDPGIFDLDKGVEKLGLDSMQAMSTSNQIYQTFQVRITSNGMLGQNLSTNEISQLINTQFLTSDHNVTTSGVTQPCTEETLTYMEYTFYMIYCINPSDPSLYYINEITIPESVAKLEIWETIAVHLMSRHEVLRTTFEKVAENEHIRWNVKRKINPVGMKPDFRMVDAEDVDMIEKHTTEAFKLEMHGPLRFIYIKGKSCYFRTVYNSIGFDMQGIGTIFKDIVDIFLFVQHDIKLSNLKTVGGSLIVVEMEKVLQENGQALKNFWKKCLEVDIPTICLGAELKSTHSGIYLLEKLILEPSVCDALVDLTKSKGLSMYKLITSFYQLFLHLITNERNVAISTTVDVKQYIPNVANAVGLGTNYIPLLAKFPSDDFSVEEFLQNNKAALQDAIDHCVCPVDIIKELVGSEKITNILRNKVVIVEDEFVIPLLKLARDEGYTFEATKSEDMGTHTETQFSIWSRTKEKLVTFELTYNSNIISQTRARDVMNAFKEFLVKIISDISVTAERLRNVVSIKKLRSDINK